MSHKFYVIRNLNRNVIIGLDWLKSRGVRVYHDLSSIRVHETYIPLVDDKHIASVARVKAKICQHSLGDNGLQHTFTLYDYRWDDDQCI